MGWNTFYVGCILHAYCMQLDICMAMPSGIDAAWA